MKKTVMFKLKTAIGKYLLTVSLLFFYWVGLAQSLTAILPKNNANVAVQTPSLSWNALSGATSYTVWLSQDATFSTGLIQSPALSVTNWTSSTLSFGTWYWKVVATTASGTQSGTRYTFTVYNPSQETTLALWLKADEGVTLDGSNLVQSWTDQSPNAYVLSQTTTSKRPYVTSNSLNGQAGLTFSGAQVLDGGDILDLTNISHTIFSVGKFTGNNQNMYAKGNSTTFPSRYSLLRFSNQTLFVYQESSDNHLFSTTTSNNFGIYRVENNRLSSSNKLFLNNNLIGSKTISSTYNFQSTFRFLIGAFNGTNDIDETYYLIGDVNEMIFTNTVDTLITSNINKYLRYKYAPPVNLGKDTLAPNFCSVTLTAPSGYTSMLWSDGSSGSTMTVTQGGQYWLQGTDIFGNVSRDTIQVNYPTIQAPVNTGICAGLSNTWDTGLGAAYTYLWSNNSTDSMLVISSPGTFSVTVTDGSGCSKSSPAYTFTVDNYPLTASLGNDTSLCWGNPIGLQVGASQTVSYLWPDGSTGSTYPVDTTGNYYVEATNVNNCVAHDTIYITVTGIAPVAAFNTSNVCDGIAAVFTDQSTNAPSDNISSWHWNFGDGNTSTSQNPTHVYGVDSTYTVHLYVETIGGCGATISHPVTVYQNPHAVYAFSGHCSEDQVQYTDQSTNGTGTINAWLWNFGQPSSGMNNSSVLQNPAKLYSEANTFSVILQVTDDLGCVDDTTVQVVVDPSPTAAFTADNSCIYTNIPFTNTSSAVSPSTLQYTIWNFGDNTSSALSLPQKYFSNDGQHTISLTVTASNGCTNTLQQEVTIYPQPDATMNIGPLCYGSYTTLTDISTIASGSVDSSFWVINNSIYLGGSPVDYAFPSLGQHSISLHSISDQGCVDIVSQYVEITSTIDASFDVTSSIVAALEEIEFTNTSTGGSSAFWQFGDDSSSTDYDASHAYSSSLIDSTVEVLLIVTGPTGCIDSVVKTLTIESAVLDLAVTKLYLQQTGSFYTVGAELYNVGSVSVVTADLVVITKDGPQFMETWTGELIPGAHTIYLFNGKVNANVSTQDEETAFLCVNGTGYDLHNLTDINEENDKACRNIENTSGLLLPVSPNPAFESVQISILLPASDDVTLELIDASGKIIQRLLDGTLLSAGFYTYTLDLSQVNAGMYFVRMINGSGKQVEKIVKE